MKSLVKCVFQAQLTCSIPELELDEDLKEVIMGSIKLTRKILYNHYIQKHQVVSAVNKAWNLRGEVMIIITSTPFSFTLRIKIIFRELKFGTLTTYSSQRVELHSYDS